MTRASRSRASRSRRPSLVATAMVAGVALAALSALAGPASEARADTSPGPPVAGIECAPEQYPAAGSPRSSPYVPYLIPFTATLGPDPTPADATDGAYTSLPTGGYLQIDGSSTLLPGVSVEVVLGGPVVANAGNMYARGCGQLDIPGLNGTIAPTSNGFEQTAGQTNPNFVFSPNIPVSIGLSPAGITLPTGTIVGSTVTDGTLTSTLSSTPAANGGLNVDFYGSFKSTNDFTGLLKWIDSQLGSGIPVVGGLVGNLVSEVDGVLKSGGLDCTVAIGDLETDGLPAADVGQTGLSPSEATTPVTFTTQTSGSYTGEPVTGPIAPDAAGHAQDQADLVANQFPVGAIAPDMPDAAGATGDCSASSASLLNELLGLPAPAGQNLFNAPATFGVYTSS